MMSAGIGELAALGTAFSWGVSSQVQGVIARMAGSTTVTLLRQPYQIFYLLLMCFLLQVDFSISPEVLGLLFLSGVFGVCICDFCFYWAVTILGPAVAVMLLSSSTLFSALLGWMFLGEVMNLQAMAGISVSLLGMVWVLTEHSTSILLPGQEAPVGKRLWLGIGLCIFGAVMLSISFLLFKMGLQQGGNVLWNTLVRLLSGAVVLWTVGLFRGWTRMAFDGVRKFPKITLMLFASSSFGAGGMWLSGIAMANAPVGIAAMLINLQPVMVTLVGALWFRRCPSARSASGILIAFLGTALVCLR